ncbi:hypothetical protein ACSMXM_01195 [Pacificimonas sp. ICDLI1SI03]
MNSETFMDRALAWLGMLHIRLAYRIVWLGARLGHNPSYWVYRAMWDANLDLPPLPKKEGK